MRLMGLPNTNRYPDAEVSRDGDTITILFSGEYYGEQTMSVPLEYLAADAEEAELMLLAQLREIGYRVRRETG